MTLKIAPASPFVFAIGIMGLDLNDNTKRYFDISLISVHYSSGLLKDSVNSTDLVPCTIDHFSMSNSTSSDFNRLTSSKRWLCPPVNSTFTLRGRYTSTNLNLLQVTVTKCDPLLRGKPPCATDAVINQLQLELGTFTLNFLFVNPLINPSSQDYLGYYLEDRNYIAFTTSFGGYGNAFIGKYTINTDVSSLPF